MIIISSTATSINHINTKPYPAAVWSTGEVLMLVHFAFSGTLQSVWLTASSTELQTFGPSESRCMNSSATVTPRRARWTWVYHTHLAVFFSFILFLSLFCILLIIKKVCTVCASVPPWDHISEKIVIDERPVNFWSYLNRAMNYAYNVCQLNVFFFNLKVVVCH